MSEGASCPMDCADTRDESDMPASGLATRAGTPSCSSTMSAMPWIDEQPPASTIWSTLLNSEPAKKN